MTSYRMLRQATPTSIIRCDVYWRVGLISLKHGICTVFAGGQRIFEETWYVEMTTDRERTLQLMYMYMYHLCTSVCTTISMNNLHQLEHSWDLESEH